MGNAASHLHFDKAGIKRKTASSIIWTLFRTVSDQVFSFCVFVLMAHLLTKREIGVFAIAYIFAEVGRALCSNAVTQLIAKQVKLTHAFIDTVFWSNIIAAMLYSLITLLIIALPLSLFQEPGLRPVLAAMVIPVIINAIGSTHLALRLRDFGHKTIAIRSVVSGLVGGSLAISAALLGYGVWSLVIQRVANEMVGAILSWLSYKWTPSFRYDLNIFRSNISFSGNLTIAQLIFLFLVRIQDLIVGGALGPSFVATYRVAWRLIETFAVGTIQPFAGVALQTFSRLAEDTLALRASYRTFIRLCSAVSFPAVVGLGVLSPELVYVVYGAKWAEAGVLGQVFAFMAIPFTLNYFASPVLSAVGEGRRQRTLAIIQLISTITITASFVHFGLLWVVIGYVIRSYLTLPIQMLYLSRSTSIKPIDTWNAIKWPFLCSACMGCSIAVLKSVFPLPAFSMLVLGFVVGLLIYMITLWYTSPDIIKQVREFLVKRRSVGVNNE